MALLDALLRYPSQTLCLLLIAFVWRDGRKFLQAKILIAFLISTIADSFVTAPAGMQLPAHLMAIALFVAIPASALLWWFVCSVMRDNFRLGFLEWGVMGLACAFKLGWVLQAFGIMPPWHSFRYWGAYTISFLMLGHILWTTMSGLRQDLIPSRRKARLWLLFVIGVAAILGTAVELIGYPSSVEATIRHGMTLPILFWICLWAMRLQPGKLLFVNDQDTVKEPQEISPKDLAAHKRLLHIMEEEAAYSDHGLTITKLAQRVGIPEHQLRALINETMGYRNFPSFLNRYRIDYAKVVMSDLEQARLPILTISLDAGFQTLSTFNRAFRALEDETPSEFRRRALEAASKSN